MKKYELLNESMQSPINGDNVVCAEESFYQVDCDIPICTEWANYRVSKIGAGLYRIVWSETTYGKKSPVGAKISGYASRFVEQGCHLLDVDIIKRCKEENLKEVEKIKTDWLKLVWSTYIDKQRESFYLKNKMKSEQDWVESLPCGGGFLASRLGAEIPEDIAKKAVGSTFSGEYDDECDFIQPETDVRQVKIFGCADELTSEAQYLFYTIDEDGKISPYQLTRP